MNGYLLDTNVALLPTTHSIEDGTNPRAWWLATIEQLAATPQALCPDHVSGVCVLPPIHKDPFDRLLIAQAMAESLTLLTTDTEIARYASEQFCVLS